MKVSFFQAASVLGTFMSTFVWSQLLDVAHGMAELTPEMLQARNYEELREAERGHRQTKDDSHHRRARLLQKEGLDDSQHILSDHFGGTPGFYHGVASGKYLYFAMPLYLRWRCILLSRPRVQDLINYVSLYLYRRPYARRCDCLDALHAC